MELNPGLSYLNTLLYEMPAAYASIEGSSKYPNLHGMVRFYPVTDGVLVNAELYNLPVVSPICSNHVFGFHIHQGTSCSGNAQDPFADAGLHYNPGGCEHPAHGGDLPPLFATHEGFAWGVILSDRFKWGDILGHTVIVHDLPDDFRSQPAGNSGEKIGCGVIQKTTRSPSARME